MMRRCLGFVVLAFLSAAGLCYGQAPAYSSLQQAWQSEKGACGTITALGGLYMFTVGDGPACVTSVGADLVTFNIKSPSGPKVYMLVPIDHVVLQLQVQQ